MCIPPQYSDFTGQRCWASGWGKDAFGQHGNFQNVLKKVSNTSSDWANDAFGQHGNFENVLKKVSNTSSGWGKDAFGQHGNCQNVQKKVIRRDGNFQEISSRTTEASSKELE